MGVIAVLAVAIVVAVGITPSPARPARPVVVSTNIWAPYVTDKDGKGPASLVVTDVLEGLGYAPTVRVGTWDRALEDVRRGRSVAAFPLVASAERRADFLISDPLLNFEYGLFRDVTAGPAPVSLDALRSLRVAGIEGYDYWPELDAAAGKYVQFNTSEAAFAALARGEVDIVAEGTVAGNTILADPGFAVDAARFARIDAPWASSQQSLHAMVARTSAGEEFLQEFNASLELHKSTPAYREAVQALSDAPTPDRVRLVGSGSLVSVHLEGDEVLRVPRGCEGVVVAWPEQLDEDASAKLKLTSGPARGRLGRVAIKDLEVLP